MARLPGAPNLTQRYRAYQLFISGFKKTDIAKEIGVSKAAITQWSQVDEWTTRAARLAREADDIIGNELLVGRKYLQDKVAQRLADLEKLCGPANHPNIRLAAIKTWLKLAGIERLPEVAGPSPLNPLTISIEDAYHEEVVAVPTPSPPQLDGAGTGRSPANSPLGSGTGDREGVDARAGTGDSPEGWGT